VWQTLLQDYVRRIAENVLYPQLNEEVRRIDSWYGRGRSVSVNNYVSEQARQV